MSFATRRHGCLCQRSSSPQWKHNNNNGADGACPRGDINGSFYRERNCLCLYILNLPLACCPKFFWVTIFDPHYFPNNYKAYITPQWSGLPKEEISDLEACHILQNVKHSYDVGLTSSGMLQSQTESRMMVKEVSDVIGTESAAGGERSHLLYDNPSAANHGRDLQWSRISHGDYSEF